MEHDERKKTNKVNLVSASDPSSRVTFEASPQVTENRIVNYNSLEPLHAPGQIQVYKNTSSRTYDISDIKLLSRTTKEADENLVKLWKLRSWCMPRFGNSSTLSADNVASRQERSNEKDQNDPKVSGFTDEEVGLLYSDEVGIELLGAPPPVLYLSAYSYKTKIDASQQTPRSGTNVWQRAQHINRVPTVITNLTIPYPNDVDYINDSNGTPIPIIMNINVTLTETHSPTAYESFSLNDFRAGILQGF